MKWTTANLKHPNYSENHELYVGTHTGSFKRLVPAYEENPFAQRNLHDIKQLDKDSRITALAFGNDTSEIIIGRAKTSVLLHSLRTEQLERTVDVHAAPVVGVARYDDQLIAGFGNGKVQRLGLEAATTEQLIIDAGDDMTHLRQCPTERNLIATGGKGRQNNLKVFDMAADGKLLFTSKNLPNDELQLEVPIWDSDVGFIDSPHTLATCSRYGYVRVYDTRKQRRPVQRFATEEQLSFATLVARGNYIYTGTTMGSMKAFDIRRMKTFVHTYKGFTGSIRDVHLDETGKYLASASLDRYVRVHHVDSTVLLYQCYVKSKATRVLIRQSLENPNAGNAQESNEEENDEDVKHNNSKNTRGKQTLTADEEYDEIFDNMQTICEKPDDAQSESDATDDEKQQNDAEVDNVPLQQTGAKRKANGKARKNKKKKQKSATCES